MLQECPECGGKVSSEAASCPHCGNPLASTPSLTPAVEPGVKRAPIFLVLAGLSFFVTLSTPSILAFLPVLATLVFAAVSLFRRERFRLISWVIIALTILGFVAVSSDLGGGSSSQDRASLAAVEIVDWNWHSDPSFGTDGAVKWNVQIRNKSSRYVEMVCVEFTTYDAVGSLISTTFTYVNAIPPGETRSEESFADYYGREKKAQVQVTDVRFSQ